MSTTRKTASFYIIIVALFGLWLCTTAFAEPGMTLDEVQSGTLLLATPDQGQYTPAPTQETRAEIRVTGPIARAVVTQRFRNPGDAWAEAIYAFPLPEDAAVDHMRMTVGDRVIEGQIQEKMQARQTYQTATREGKRAGLVEQHRPNLFTTSVANIPPHSEIEVAIEYQHLLHWRDGGFGLRFPLAITPRYNPGSAGTLIQNTTLDGGWAILPGEIPNRVQIDPPDTEQPAAGLKPVTLEVELNTGYPLEQVASRYHAIDRYTDELGRTRIELQGPVPAERDFVLEWRPRADRAPTAAFFTEHTEAGDYGLLMVMPPDAAFEQQARPPREIIFIVDTSGSMGGASIRQAREALILALQQLQPDDRFNLIQFNDQARSLFPQPISADSGHIRQALAWTNGLQANGGTNMAPALSQAFAMRNSGGHLQQVIFITDGAVSNEAELVQLIHQNLANRRLFTVGIGSAPNTHFMTEAANMGKGSFTYIGQVSEVAEKMSALFAQLEHPALTDLRLELPVEAEILPDPLPDLYLGEPVVAVMRLHGMPDHDAILGGNIGNLQWKNNLSLRATTEQSGLGVHWARSRIQQWMRAEARGEDPQKVRKAILDLGLRHHLVSRHTSLVAVDVTPVRPVEETLESHALKNNMPAGWKRPQGQARPSVPTAQVVMAQGATSFQAMLAAGLTLMLLAAALLLGREIC